MMNCSDVMTKNPTCCLPTDRVSSVAQMMKTENVGSIPVVDSNQSKRLVGIITDRDLALQVVASERDAKSTTVGDVMTRDVVTCYADDDIQKAVDAMAEHQLRRMPIVDHNQMIVGIIAQADVATRLDKPQETAEMVKDISQTDVSQG